jgi:hypothetical protein
VCGGVVVVVVVVVVVAVVFTLVVFGSTRIFFQFLLLVRKRVSHYLNEQRIKI